MTELEKKAYEIIKAESEEFENILIKEISNELNITINQAKGVIGSLIKKCLVVSGDCNGDTTYYINEEKAV